MRTQRWISAAGAALAASVAFAAGCGMFGGERYSVQRAPIVPAAAGEVDTQRDDNQNLRVTLDVERLAPPGNLTPPRSHYMVWAVGQQGAFMPMGKLRVNDEGRGQFRGIAPMEPLRLLVTAENDASLTAPQGPQVLTSGWIGN